MNNNTGHMDYLMPFNRELDIPYKANNRLKDMITYIFSHPKVPSKQRKLFIEISQSGSKQLVNDMAVRAIAMTEYFMANKQQFGYSMENIQFQILRRMHHQIFNHMFKQRRKEHTEEEWKYIGITYKLLSIDNGFFDELLRVAINKDYEQVPKKRRTKMKEGSKHFEYLCSFE